MMQGYITIAVITLLILMVLVRVSQLRKIGIKAMKFGGIDKKDYIIPPFVLLFLYIVISGIFPLPRLGFELFQNDTLRWAGVVLSILGLLLFLYSLISFDISFRVGIDEDKPGALITTGAFAISRNPIYTAFGIVLIGIFFIFPNILILVYLVAGFWLFNRQVIREEDSLKKIYGREYMEYCGKVRRYL